MNPVIDLGVSEKALRKIQYHAKKWHPYEFFAALLGATTLKGPKILDIWIPEDLESYTRNDKVYTPDHWGPPANEYAEEKDMIVLGSVHSHPYNYEQSLGRFKGRSEPSPSEGDWKLSWSNILGIAVVVETKTGRLRTRVRFYGPATAVNTSIIVAA